MLRRSFLIPLAVLAAGLVALPACKKKTPEGGGGGGGDGPSAVELPAAVKSDHLLFARLDAKQIRDSALFADLKQAFTKGDASAWNLLEGGLDKELGFKATDLETITTVVTELSAEDGEPTFVLILTSNQPVPKSGVFGVRLPAKPDGRGLYQIGPRAFAHFPDDKTIVFVSQLAVDKYLGGYGLDRTGWPLTVELTKAAAGHTVFVSARVDKLPTELRKERQFRSFEPFLEAKALTLTGNLRGKELSLAARATFADADAAGRAKTKGQEFITKATDAVGDVMKNDMSAWEFALPVMKEADRALKAARLEVSGADLTLVASYKADFDLAKIAEEAAKKACVAADRMKSSNNLKQIALGLHNHESVYGTVPVHCDRLLWMKQPGKPGLSWRVSILPYIGHEELYKQFKLDEPWDGPNNKKLIDKMPAEYVLPGRSADGGRTHYQMVIGPRAMKPPGNTIISILDGTSNTVAVVEAASPVVWTKPDDVMFPGQELPKDFRKRFGGHFAGGFNVAMWDGSVRFVADRVSDRTLGLALDPQDGNVLPSDW